MRRTYSEDEKSKVYELYEKNIKTKEIAEITGVPESTLVRWCKRKGLSRVKKMTNEELLKITPLVISLYEEGKYIDEVAAELKLTRGQVNHIISDKHGIARHRGPKSMIVKEDYFSEINTEEKAYYLGWIMADGNVSIHNNQYSLKIHISNKDRILIEKFMKAIESTNNILVKTNNEKGGDSCYVSLTSKRMIKDLISLGVKPNKSGKEIFPDIPKKLNNHFIRGYFDGDGITCIKKIKRSGFVGGTEILNAIQKEIDIKKTIRVANNSIASYFLIGRKDSEKLYEYLYDGATIWLERKKHRLEIIHGNTEVSEKITRHRNA